MVGHTLCDLGSPTPQPAFDARPLLYNAFTFRQYGIAQTEWWVCASAFEKRTSALALCAGNRNSVLEVHIDPQRS